MLTSCCYGNRYADHHQARDGSRRRSYTHDLRALTGDPDRQLDPENLGRFYAWQPQYWGHEAAWREVVRALRPGGTFVLNVSDFKRRGKVVPVVAGHVEVCHRLGFTLVASHEVPTPRMRYGANGDVRVGAEVVLVFSTPEVPPSSAPKTSP